MIQNGVCIFCCHVKIQLVQSLFQDDAKIIFGTEHRSCAAHNAHDVYKIISRIHLFVLHRIHMCCLHCDLELAWYIVLIENIWCTFYMAWLRVELCMWLEWHKICTCNMCSIGTSRTIACHRIRLSRLLPIFGLFQPKENNNFPSDAQPCFVEPHLCQKDTESKSSMLLTVRQSK